MKIQKIGKERKLVEEIKKLPPDFLEQQKESKQRFKSFFSWTNFLVCLSFFIALIFLYKASIPVTYSFKKGDISHTDIFLRRPIVDQKATEEKAKEAADAVREIFKVDEKIVKENENKIKAYIEAINNQREAIYAELKTKAEVESKRGRESLNFPDEYKNAGDEIWNISQIDLGPYITNFITKLDEIQKNLINEAEANRILSLPPSINKLYIERIERESLQILDVLHDNDSLNTDLRNKTDQEVNEGNYYKDVNIHVYKILGKLIKANAVYDENATVAARESASKAVLKSPILIEKGTRIIAKGETISEAKLDILKTLGLLDDTGLDFLTLLAVSLLLIFLYITGIYFNKELKKKSDYKRRELTIIVTLIIVFLASFYINQASSFITAIFFVPIIFTTYFSMREAILYTFLLIIAIFPITGYNMNFIFASSIGTIILSFTADKNMRRDRYARLIITSAFVPAISSLVLDLLLKNPWQNTFQNALLLATSGAFSAIAAIGSMPLYEIYLDALSPLRLIELSNQSQTLLRRLFNEAIGTYHHSVMVATLAEVAAEAIDANAMLVRVGLYHDIGKLTNPSLFTENQDGENPHDKISPYDSAKIIISHVDDGVALAERSNLPKPLLPFITEHHGTTSLLHIFQKAEKENEKLGLMPPDLADFTYKGPIPQSRETAVLMLADSVEAAMKSAGLKTIQEAEPFIRKIVSGKIEHRQLEKSGLKFDEIELIIQAFLNVYSGQLKERVKYVIDENRNK